MSADFASQIAEGLPSVLPSAPTPLSNVDRAPARSPQLTPADEALALKNALRYVPRDWHQALASEFAAELREFGHIYMHRLRPHYAMHARPIDQYPVRCSHAAAIMLMIQNNLDPAVAQYPMELITYGGNGAVFQNWAQYRLAMWHLSQMSEQETLVMYSGHPLGRFPSSPSAPRVVLTNGMMVPNYSTRENLEKFSALGVTSYGQMTAGSYMYIGPQGIVHGTTITLLGAGRLYLKTGSDGLAGKVFVTSGLGGMSGAQAKASVIAGAIGVVAEVNPAAVKKRHDQGWLMEVESDLDRLLSRIERARKNKEAVSLGYVGNVVDLWERLASSGVSVDLGSDQTSLHNPFGGGYYPVGLEFEAARAMLASDPNGFREAVQSTLRRHVAAINQLASAGMHFWDYGNAFLVEAARAGAEVGAEDGDFRYPSYVEHIMGPQCFDYGFGPFRWVCCSGRAEDLRVSDAIAAQVLARQAANATADIRQQIEDNLHWIERAEENAMVVGSQARILYADTEGRRAIAAGFNAAIAAGQLSAPIVLGRDHHDTSGTDSPWRETANIRDGSRFCADMSVHNFVGDAFRGATWVSLHNGGGVGWGEVINGGFGLVLDGSADAAERAHGMLGWDVSNGVARRAWAQNPGAIAATRRAMERDAGLVVTLPEEADDALVKAALS